MRDWAEFDLFLLETPIWSDYICEYRKLVEQAQMRIATGERLATRWEFAQLADDGALQVLQPDVGRVGGIGEARVVCDMAGERGRLIVQHCLKTGVSISATAHLAFTVPHCPFIEYLPLRLCHERLRRELTREELELGPDGTIPLPTRPGLGVEVDWDVVRPYSVA